MKKRTSLFTCLLGVLSAGAMPLVEEGKPAATILLSPTSSKSAQLGAFELQYHIQKITGATLPIVTDSTAATGGKIFIGASEAAAQLLPKESLTFKSQEYLVKAAGENLFLLGADGAAGKVDYSNERTWPAFREERGSLFAVYTFLENQLGVRWYLPTEIGETYDKRTTLKVNDFSLRRAPFMKFREVYIGPNIPADFSGPVNNRIKTAAISGRDRQLYLHRRRHGGIGLGVSHSFYKWNDFFLKSHPEYFAQGQPPGVQFCFTNPALIAEVVQRARDYFDEKPDAWQYFYPLQPKGPPLLVPLCPNDNGQFCKCAECTKLLNISQGRGKGLYTSDRASEYFFTFANKVARELKKSHPDRLVGVLAYQHYAFPPSFPLENNCLVEYCLQNRDLFNQTTMTNDQRLLEEWQKTNPKLPKTLWLYHCYPALQARNAGYEPFPGFFADTLGKQMKKFANANVIGFFCEPSYRAGGFRNILQDQLEEYLLYRMADCPELDPQKEIEDFFTRYYGKAAPAMRKFYLAVEKIYEDPASYKGKIPTRHDEFTAWNVLGTPDRMAQLKKIMDEARKLAADDEPIFQKRFEIFDKGLWQRMLYGADAFRKRQATMSASMQQTSAPRVTVSDPGNPLAVKWEDAARLGIWYGTLKGGKVPRSIQGYIAHDGKYLYIRIVDPVQTASLTNLSDWGDGCEIFLSTQRGEPCWQLMIGHNGNYSIATYGTPSVDKKLVHVATDSSAKNRFVLSVAVPLEMIQAKVGKMYYLNVLRNQKEKNEACWIPTFGGHFVPARNGEVFLEK